MLRRLECRANLSQVFERDAEAPHAGIHFQVDGMLVDAEPDSGLVEQFDLPGLPDGWRELKADDFFFFAAPEAGHEQDEEEESGGVGADTVPPGGAGLVGGLGTAG